MSDSRVRWAIDWSSSASTVALVPEPSTAGIESVPELSCKCSVVVTVVRMGVADAATFVVVPRVVLGAAAGWR